MRLFALILLLANLLFWSYTEYFAPRTSGNALAQQVHPERMRLLSNAEIAQLPTANGPACIEFGPLDNATLATAKDKVRKLQPRIVLAERYGGEGAFLELRRASDAVRKAMSELLGGDNAGVCAA
jgi:hypothetical protein